MASRSRSIARNGTRPTTTTTTSRPQTGRSSRPRTVETSTDYIDNEIICAISESRGISPTVGLSFVNVSTSEAVLCQFTDTQTYARTCHKLAVFAPCEILYTPSATDSKLVSIIAENLEVDKANIALTKIDRKYWSDISGLDYVQELAFPSDLESLQLPIAGNYFATCCFSAVMKYIDMCLGLTFSPQSLRIKFEPSEGSMMIDLSTMASLELIQNLQNAKSQDCLFGLLNQTMTPMGARFLRSNVLQPSTDAEKIQKRQEALNELTSKEDIFFAVRTALKSFVDADRVLAALVIISTSQDFHYMEHSVNNVLMLKTFVDSIKPIWQALAGAHSEELQMIRLLCDPMNYVEVENLIKSCINEGVSYSARAVELRNQRVFAIKAGVNSFLDVARQAYKELNDDVNVYFNELRAKHELALDLKYDPARQYYLRFPAAEVSGGTSRLPRDFINVFKKNKHIECQTLDLMKMNQKIKDGHNEVVTLSDSTVQELIEHVRGKIHPLFKISESIAMLDMLAGFAQLVTTSMEGEYVKPEINDGDASLMIKAGRHPIREKLQSQNHHSSSSSREKFVPNDVYATRQNRFHVITGANMSGKSTYIRSLALMAIMAQIGCFVPASYASFPLSHELFARVSTDDSIEANVSTFASEMREMAFILRNISSRSLVIVDELGRGTSTTDGLSIAIAVAEALIDSHALVWFVTHFRDLPRILAERAGVSNLHLAVDISHSDSSAEHGKMTLRYKVLDGYEEEKFYGLALARVLGLPDDVLDVATRVSQALHERNEARKRNPRATAVARRRKLILNVREQLSQARDSAARDWIPSTGRASGASRASEGSEGVGSGKDRDLEDNEDDEGVTADALRAWLKRLQVEFTIRMRAIDADVEGAATLGLHNEEDVEDLQEREDDTTEAEIEMAHDDVKIKEEEEEEEEEEWEDPGRGLEWERQWEEEFKQESASHISISSDEDEDGDEDEDI